MFSEVSLYVSTEGINTYWKCSKYKIHTKPYELGVLISKNADRCREFSGLPRVTRTGVHGEPLSEPCESVDSTHTLCLLPSKETSCYLPTLLQKGWVCWCSLFSWWEECTKPPMVSWLGRTLNLELLRCNHQPIRRRRIQTGKRGQKDRACAHLEERARLSNCEKEIKE